MIIINFYWVADLISDYVLANQLDRLMDTPLFLWGPIAIIGV